MAETIPITVQPGMTLPIMGGTVTSSTSDNSMNVGIAVTAPSCGGVSILLTLGIKVTIESTTVKINYTRLTTASGQVEIFNSILPIGSIIQDIIPTYDVVENVIA